MEWSTTTHELCHPRLQWLRLTAHDLHFGSQSLDSRQTQGLLIAPALDYSSRFRFLLLHIDSRCRGLISVWFSLHDYSIDTTSHGSCLSTSRRVRGLVTGTLWFQDLRSLLRFDLLVSKQLIRTTAYLVKSFWLADCWILYHGSIPQPKYLLPTFSKNPSCIIFNYIVNFLILYVPTVFTRILVN